MSCKDPPLFSKIRAAKAYYDFTGHKPKSATRRRLDSGPVAGYRMGPVVGIAYEATRDGETAQYFHRFKKTARPDLVSRSDGKQLYISGGKYKVTDRGIEDMPSLFVINPSRRRKSRKGVSKRRRSSKGAFMANPRRRRRRRSVSTVRRRRRSVSTYRANPRRRRRRSSVAVRVMRRNPSRRRRRYSVVGRRRYRRNPSFRRNPISLRGIKDLVVPAAFVGAGAVGTEIMMGYLPIPASWKVGPVKYAVKGGVAIAAGMLLSKMVSRRLGEAFAMGGVAIAVHDAIRAWLAGAMPNVQFGQYNWAKYRYPMPSMNSYPQLGYYSAGATMPVGMGAYVRPRGMGAYVTTDGGTRTGTFRP